MTAAIAYKNGVSRAELAEWYDVQRRTIYSWFKRLFFEPLEQAVHDDHRSGRSGKLTAGQQAQLAKTLQESSTETGYDTPAWTPMLVQQYLDEQFGMEYSRPSCHRLMKEVGLSYQQPCRKTAEAGAEDRNTFDDELKKSGELDATVVCIDQTRNQYKPSRVVSARHAQPAVDLSSQRDWTCLLGAITEDGNRFFSRFTEYVTGEHSKHFILALCEEFDDDLIVVLDGAPYVQAAVVTDLAARDALALVWLPARIHRN